jgi:hypothetical protein
MATDEVWAEYYKRMENFKQSAVHILFFEVMDQLTLRGVSAAGLYGKLLPG